MSRPPPQLVEHLWSSLGTPELAELFHLYLLQSSTSSSSPGASDFLTDVIWGSREAVGPLWWLWQQVQSEVLGGREEGLPSYV